MPNFARISSSFRKSLVIAMREYLAAVRTKAFVVSMVFLPVMMGGSIGVSAWLQNAQAAKERTYAVVDHTPGGRIGAYLRDKVRERYRSTLSLQDTLAKFDNGQKLPSLPTFTMTVVAPAKDAGQQRADLSDQVRKGVYTGFLEIGADVTHEPSPGELISFTQVLNDPKQLTELLKDPAQARKQLSAHLPDRMIVRFEAKNPAMASKELFFDWAHTQINQAVRDERCRRAGLSASKVEAIVKDVPMIPSGLTIRTPNGQIVDATVASVAAPLIVPVAVVVLMFMMLMVGATPAMQGVVEEKTQRIAEVLLGSVRPFPLMMGKLLGLVSVSLTLAGVYLGGGYWAAHHYDVAQYVDTSVFIWFLVYQALAVLMYGSLFIAIGAACTDLRETQTLVMPVMLLASIPIWFLNALIFDPDGVLVTAVSFFPPATPMLMVARMAVPPGVPWWQPWVGIVGVLATTLVCVYAAGRIFRVGLLMQGKGAKLGEMMRWVISG